MDTDTEINMDTDMDTETDEQVFIKSPHLEIVAPWLAYRREGVYYFAYHEAYADVAFIALLEQEEMMLYPFHSRPILRMLPLRHLRPGGEASLRTPEQLGQFPLLALHTVKPNFSQSCLLRVSSTTYTYLSHVIPPPVPRRRPVPLLALSPFSLCGVPGGSPADTGPYPRGE